MKPPVKDRTDFIGRSQAMREVLARLERAAASDAPVFITGETGTGKELCARHLHEAGARASGPFVAVNCAAIPSDLAESEFFGHVRGAFTGADRPRKGHAELAHGGTLFLDEICEMDLALQGKLLRLVESSRVRPLGAHAERPVDVRIICATNRDPQREMREGRFRADLFWRLHVLPVALPPLRERGEDIVLLARHFLDRFAQEEKRPPLRLAEDAADLLLAHDWPGNVRQLQNTLRQLSVFHEGDVIRARHLRPLLPAADGQQAALAGSPRPLRQLEREAIEEAIAACGGSVPRAARQLGVAPSTLYRKRSAWSRAMSA